MFDRIKSALSALTAGLSQRTLSEKELDELLRRFELSLLESDVAREAASSIISRLREDLIGFRLARSVDANSYIKTKLSDAILAMLANKDAPDLLERIKSKKSSGDPFIVVFLGINGTGKTTTIAKFAHMLTNRGFSVVLACADTHRAGAIEQLAEHASRLSVKMVSQKYGADPAAVARDAILYARSHHVDVVLVDTAGRMQTYRNLMEEMSKIIRVAKPDLKIFVGDALAGNDAISQAKEFLSFADFDGAILTKLDADVKGGAALSIAYATGKPILFVGIGQSYHDLEPFDPNVFIDSLFRET